MPSKTTYELEVIITTLKHQIEQLTVKAREKERIITGYEACIIERDKRYLKLQGETQALRKDAERYRFLRNVDPDVEDPAIMLHVQNDWGNWSYLHLSENDADAAIEAAMSTPNKGESK